MLGKCDLAFVLAISLSVIYPKESRDDFRFVCNT